MKKLVSYWLGALEDLMGDYLISFYAFFTIIFAECAFLWAKVSSDVAKPFTIILILYILNVLVCGFFKGNWENTRIELIASIVYVIIFVTLFIIGCTFNIVLSIVLTVIPLAITFVCIQIRENGDCVYWTIKKPKVAKFLYNFGEFMILVCPYVIFVICFAMIPTIPITVKIVIPILYFLCMPLYAQLEDDLATCDIFEIAYDVTWLYMRKLEKLEEKRNKKD